MAPPVGRGQARAEGRKPRRRQAWVSLSHISRPAIDAVLISEDSSFYLHQGVDTAELEQALREAWKERKLGRGASPLTQQLAKNLWLSTDRGLLRKAKERVLAHRLEEALPKNRILTLYLNVVEWGSGVYGIEACPRCRLRPLTRTSTGSSARRQLPGSRTMRTTRKAYCVQMA